MGNKLFLRKVTEKVIHYYFIQEIMYELCIYAVRFIQKICIQLMI